MTDLRAPIRGGLAQGLVAVRNNRFRDALCGRVLTQFRCFFRCFLGSEMLFSAKNAIQIAKKFNKSRKNSINRGIIHRDFQKTFKNAVFLTKNVKNATF